jgi:membrane protease YdiL (CAAX protease family)
MKASAGRMYQTNHWSWNFIVGSLRSHQLTVYIIFVFLVAWSVWLPMVASANGLIDIRFPVWFLWVAGIAPIGAATLVEWIFRGKPGVRKLYSRFLVRGVPFRWYCTAAALPVCIGLAQILVTGGSISLATIGLAMLTLIKGTLYAPLAAFEEVGWRGFALPRLQARFNALISSLILGLIWAIWHLPLFWSGSFGYSDMSFGWWSVEVLAVSILATWLFNNGRGGLWIPCLFHATANMSYATLAHIQGNPIVSLIGCVIALVVILIFGSSNLSRTQPRQIET